jgi:hypothetical protein
MIRPASEISFVPTDTPAATAKRLMIGKKDALASSGASSTIVYSMSGCDESVIIEHLFFSLKYLRMGRAPNAVEEFDFPFPLHK